MLLCVGLFQFPLPRGAWVFLVEWLSGEAGTVALKRRRAKKARGLQRVGRAACRSISQR